MTIEVNRKFSKTPAKARDLITQEQANSCSSVAATIRLCKAAGDKLTPPATNGEIARFLGIRPQWVHNVITNPPKKG